MLPVLFAFLLLGKPSPPGDLYAFRFGAKTVRAKVTGSLQDTKAFALAPGSKHWQSLKIPVHCYPINRNDDDLYPGQWSRPEAGRIDGGIRPTIWIICHTWNMDCEESILVFYQLLDGRFERILSGRLPGGFGVWDLADSNVNPHQLGCFGDRGSFYVSGNRPHDLGP